MFSISQFFEVLWKLALPVGILSFLMVGWALRNGVLKERSGMRALAAEIKAMAKANKKGKKESNGGNVPRARTNPIHGKWLKFGGGFYGIVALYTYGLVEWKEITQFIASFGGFTAFINSLSFDVLVRIFVEGLKNFITAISWPVYWMRDFGSQVIWVWMAIAYAAYWAGMKLALRHIVLKSNAGK